MRKAVSISAVATAAGVSITTVSHVLSGNRPVRSDTAMRVRRVMKELGFTPNHYARSLARGATCTLGLIVPDIANSFFADLAGGVEEAAEALGYNTILCSTGFDQAKEDRYLTMMGSGSIDGLIYGAGAPPSPVRLATLAESIPLALVDEVIPGAHGITVTSDNARGGELVAELLASYGHRDVLVVSGPEGLVTSDARQASFCRAFEAGGGAVHVVRGDFREDSGAAGVTEALAQGSRFTAVFALNDLMAIGAMQALRAADLRIPDDVSVVGFDDIREARIVTPPLATVHQDIRGLGVNVAERIVGRLRQRSPAATELCVLDVALVERGSVARVGDGVRSANLAGPHGKRET